MTLRDNKHQDNHHVLHKKHKEDNDEKILVVVVVVSCGCVIWFLVCLWRTFVTFYE